MDVTLEQALQQIVAANQLFYKVMNPKTIMVIPDNAQKRAQYEEQVIVNFPISHVDPQELAQTHQPGDSPGGPGAGAGRDRQQDHQHHHDSGDDGHDGDHRADDREHDKPRAEVIVDVQILEVSRTRAKQFGIDLGYYAINAVVLAGAGRSAYRRRRRYDRSGRPLNPRPFNANTISRGISTTDFYLAVPSAVVRFLETDTETKVIAKPQLRGAEGPTSS